MSTGTLEEKNHYYIYAYYITSLRLRLLHPRLLHLLLTTQIHLRLRLSIGPRPQENLRLRLTTYYRSKEHARTTQGPRKSNLEVITQ